MERFEAIRATQYWGAVVSDRLPMGGRIVTDRVPVKGTTRLPRVPVVEISLEQVIAFRTTRHHLAVRASPRSLTKVLGDIGGAQAQLLAAAQLAMAGRVQGLKPETLEAGLWKHRSLAKAWCMRQTLHLVPSSKLAIFVRGTSKRVAKEVRWMRNRGASEADLSALIEATMAALDEPITRQELAERVARSLNRPIQWRHGGGWGNDRRMPCVKVGPVICPAHYMIQLAGAGGVVCSGPSRGAEATFVRADRWVVGFQDVTTDAAEEELLRIYLRGYGPATVEDFVAWTRMNYADARRIWARVAPETVAVRGAEEGAAILKADLAALERATLDGPTVRFLPHFDSYLLGHMDRGHLMGEAHRGRVYRSAGWVAPVVLIDGRAQGVWGRSVTKGTFHVTVRPFGRIPQRLLPLLREEARELSGFFDCSDSVVEILPN